MTAEEESKEVPSKEENVFDRNSSFTKQGLLASRRERGEDLPSTPESKPSVFGNFFSSPKTPIQAASSPADETMTTPSSAKSNINKFLTPSKTFVRLRDEKEELSKLTPSPPSYGLHEGGLNLPLIGEVKFKTVLDFAKNWLRNPKNIALLIWGLGVGISGAILFMVMVGMLNAVIPSRNARNTWFEVSNQIINALFTLMALYLHPQRCMNLRMLIRWNPSDIIKLRRMYCKDGLRKPHEWGHMLVIVMLLQLNCIAQYCLCGLNWGYRRAQRPAIGVAICLCTSFGAGAAAGIYNSVSPLGKDYDKVGVGVEGDDLEEGRLKEVVHQGEFVPRTRIYRILERRVSFAYKDEGSIVDTPEWKGGVCDCTSDKNICVVTAVCSFCVFGWNMDRLGFGNRYVHIITFILICTAPFWIFDLAALNIQNHVVRNSIGATGIVLCVFGLFYGGYWRIRMREKFRLPGNKFCCGKSGVTDCFQWLFLPFCSLCQEVRTAEFYDVKDDRFYSRGRVDPNSPPPPTSPRSPFVPILEAPGLGAMSRDDLEMRQFDGVVDGPHRGHDQPYRKSPLGQTSGQPSSSGEADDAEHNSSAMPLPSSRGVSPSHFASPQNTNGVSPHGADDFSHSPARLSQPQSPFRDTVNNTQHRPLEGDSRGASPSRFASPQNTNGTSPHGADDFSHSPSRVSQPQSPFRNAVNNAQHRSVEGDGHMQSSQSPSHPHAPQEGLGMEEDSQPGESGSSENALPSQSSIPKKSS